MGEPAMGCASEHGCQDLQHNMGALFALSGFARPGITLDGSGLCDVGSATWLTDMTCQCGRREGCIWGCCGARGMTLSLPEHVT